jgi:hypothetical protein
MVLNGEDETYKSNFLKTINGACDAHEKLYDRINNATKDISGTQKACQIIGRICQYNSKVGCKFNMVKADIGSSLEILAKPLMPSKATASSATSEREATFIPQDQTNMMGGINWNDCLKQNHAEGLSK